MSFLQSNASTQQHCGFIQRSARLLRNAYDMNPKPFAIMRDHIDQITNWYRHGQNVDEAYPERSSASISFDECFLAVIEDEPPALAAIGSQFNFLTSDRRKLLASHLFSNKRTPLDMLTQLWRLTWRYFYALLVKMNSHYSTG
jgi:hypothetical protein